MKKIVVLLLLSVIISLCLSGCSSNNKETNKVDDKTLTNEIVDYFMPLTKIPRQSHHEEKISEYLYNWAKERGFSPRCDQENNVIFDVPASSGMENAPLTILQAHMDMVIAIEDGKEFNPLKDSITVINDGKTLTADGTSLGADNGMGVSIILHLIEHSNSHGPLRIIFTTNEEDGMSGAFALTSEDVKDAKYVINLDSENSSEVTNSSAAGIVTSFFYKPNVVSPTKDKALMISINGLLGGHSGLDINKGRLNGIKAIGSLLKLLVDKGIDYELVSIIGGNATNSIPAKVDACLVVSSSDENKVKDIVNEYTKELEAKYDQVETDLNIDVDDYEIPKLVLTKDSKDEVIKFITNIQDGINTMSSKVEGLVESSSNIGLLSIDASKEDSSSAGTYIRSSSSEILQELINNQKSLANECNFDVEIKKVADAWPVKLDNKLLTMIQSAYHDITGKEMKVIQLHAGLETGTFSALDSNLDIVSIGVDLLDAHSINESCNLETLPIVYRVTENTLKEIGKEILK